jgi:uncharacterized membrane protein
VALYFAVFGVIVAVVERDRRIGLATTALSVVWLGVALGIAIPFSRGLYSLDATNPFLEGRYGGLADAAGRLISVESLSRIVTVFSATGFACLLAPTWAAIALPGMLMNLAAAPDTLQAGLLGHYLWPILPWLFVAAAIGAGRLGGQARWVAVIILLVALIDLPLPRAVARTPWQQPDAAGEVLQQLQSIPLDASVLAQPNLIPHLPRRFQVHALGVYTAGQPDDASIVLLAREGDLWPFTKVDIETQAARYAADPRFERLTDGPLIVFRRR